MESQKYWNTPQPELGKPPSGVIETKRGEQVAHVDFSKLYESMHGSRTREVKGAKVHPIPDLGSLVEPLASQEL